ncbi:MAG: glycosyltransferase [Solirubrobacteraceae bacterium]
MKVAVVAEYYPRAADPVLGIWAHRQALAAREAGAEVRVLVLHRLVPPKAAVRALDLRAAGAILRQPRRATLDGIEVEYVPFASPSRDRSYGSWGTWAAPALALALARLRRRFAFELVHAHYAVPAGDAVRRIAPRAPLVVSVHGGDVLWTVHRGPRARRSVERTLSHARLVIANSAGTAERCRRHGARAVRVVHLGTDLPHSARDAGAGGEEHAGEGTGGGEERAGEGTGGGEERGGGEAAGSPPTLVTVGHLVARKRHADVVRALAALRPRHPDLRYVIVGDGPEREAIRRLAEQEGVADRVELRGELPHEAAVREARAGTVFVLPSVDEAFGVAYVEAMAGGVPAVGSQGEDGPEELVAAGGGVRLVLPRDPPALAAALDGLLSDDDARRELGHQARATVEREFTWERCGQDTVEAYAAALQ